MGDLLSLVKSPGFRKLPPERQEYFRGLLDGFLKQRQLEEARKHPAGLLDHTLCVDTESGDEFRFHLNDPSSGWYWQRELLDWWLAHPRTCVLKARQLGVTWLSSGLMLWYLLFKPGTRCLAVSITEKDANKVLQKIWGQFQSLPPHLKNHVKVVKPSRGGDVISGEIVVKHEDGRLSSVTSLTSTPRAGHGETAAIVVLDEFARQEYARETWKAVLPTAAKGGHIITISTGNGVSTDEGEGNYFHYVYTNADEIGVERRFLRWDLHPDRDDQWYETFAMGLLPSDRGEQYPRNEREAFILTGDPFFDEEGLLWYEDHILEPVKRGRFESRTTTARWKDSPNGPVRLYRLPEQGRSYAVGVDTAGGTGRDYSAAFVVDLYTMEICAEIHGKLDPDLYAEQLHFLGRYYKTALIAVEEAGGWGIPVINALRDGRDGRPRYPNLYRHRQDQRIDNLEHKTFGFPMTQKTRGQVLSGLARHIRDRDFDAIPKELMLEMATFVHRETHPTPRAQDGCNDDRVMALAIAVEVFRRRGEHPQRPKPKTKRYERPYAWAV